MYEFLGAREARNHLPPPPPLPLPESSFVHDVHDKQKVGSTTGVTLVAGPTFLHINTLAHLAEARQ